MPHEMEIAGMGCLGGRLFTLRLRSGQARAARIQSRLGWPAQTHGEIKRSLGLPLRRQIGDQSFPAGFGLNLGRHHTGIHDKTID